MIERQSSLSGIIPQRQQTASDCGQTCLDMVGKRGHETIQGRPVRSNDLRQIPGMEQIYLKSGKQDLSSPRGINADCPHMWNILSKNNVSHWILTARDKVRNVMKVICPTLGEMDAKEYQAGYVEEVRQGFRVAN